MGYFKDKHRIIQLHIKEYEQADRYKTYKSLRLSPDSEDLNTFYLGTDTIYAELDSPYSIKIIRRYVHEIEKPTPDMSRRVRQANTSYMDLVFSLGSNTVIQDESILPGLMQQVLNDTYDFGELTVRHAWFSLRYMEWHLKNLKKSRFSKRRNPNHRKDIARLRALLKQKPVISEIQHYAYTPRYRSYEEVFGSDETEDFNYDYLPL